MATLHIVVAAKQVLDPEAVNSYALWGRLTVDNSGREFTVGGVIPRIINAYDEQALEAALRIRDAGVPVTITAISVGSADASEVLKRCVAMGADKAVLVVDPECQAADGFRTAWLIADEIRRLGDVDLVLCGRQGSDYDQGAVPGVLAELLDAALVTLAASVAIVDGGIRVERATPVGLEVVEASLPAVVSVSNELGLPRYPTSRGMMEARRKPPEVRQAEAGETTTGGVELCQLTVPSVQGACQMVGGQNAAEQAAHLFDRLAALGAFDA